MRKKRLVRFIVLFFILASVPITIFLVSRETSFVNKAYYSLFGTRAELVINLTNSAEIESYPWQYLAQGGEEKQNMLSSVINQVARVKPKYIRIDHVFDYYNLVQRNTNGDLIYDWSGLDGEIDLILQTGAKPYVSLSYMPQVLSETTEGLPYSWDEWGDVVKKTIEHISGKNGLSIKDVYYEVWNEPDLFGGFSTKGGKNYLTLYHYSHDAAIAAGNVWPFKLGGPATTGLSKIWFDDFFTYASINKLRVDFFSWHRYAEDIQIFEEDVYNAMNWLTKYPKYLDCELVISETGMTGEVDSVYDQEISAIHTLSLYTSLFQKINKVFLFEIKDGPGIKQYWGRWGILTHEKYGIPVEKPRYKAIEFLQRAEGAWFPVFGQGTWVKALATQRDGVVKVLMVNYDPYGRHIENVPLTLVNLPYKDFTFRRSDFLGNVESYDITVDEDYWTTRQLMEANTAALIEIIPRE